MYLRDGKECRVTSLRSACDVLGDVLRATWCVLHVACVCCLCLSFMWWNGHGVLRACRIVWCRLRKSAACCVLRDASAA